MLKAKQAAMAVSSRALKLGALSHWWYTGVLRAFGRWALILDLRVGYDAALGVAAQVVNGELGALAAAIDADQRQTVHTLLLEPSLLQPLGEVRHGLQQLASRAEELRSSLGDLCAGAPGTQRLLPWAGTAAELVSARERRAAERSGADGGEAAREGAYVRLKMRLLVASWRRLRRALADQALVLREFSEQRGASLAALGAQATDPHRAAENRRANRRANRPASV